MRRKRPAAQAEAAPRTADPGEGTPTPARPGRDHRPRRPQGHAPAEVPVASLESMFQEISSGEAGGTRAQATGQLTARYDDLWQLSMADPMTGLANRMLLLDRLTRELARRQRHGGCVIVSHIELGNLKEINDELGYSYGSEVLRDMSRRLTSMLRSEDTVSRVSETELVAVMTIEHEEFLEPLMRRVQAALDNPIRLAGRDGAVRLGATLGTVTARDAESAEEVLARAGHAA
jgi:diguanylate cyclase (GGDEF)-like protein